MLNPNARHGAEALSHQAKSGVVPIPKPERRDRKPSRLRRSSKPKLSPATMAVAYGRCGGECSCGCGRAVDPHDPACYHHVFPKQRWPHLIDHVNNVVCVAVDCHANHETAAQRFPRKITPHANLLAEGDPSMQDYLAKVYTG